MAAPPSLPPNFQISEADAKNNDLKISKVYLHHAYRDPSQHLTIVKPGRSDGFGETAANNWGIHNGPDPSKDLVVAHAKGLHINGGGWHNCFTIVFEVDGLKGSTLHVMGVGVDKGDEQWGIVGGTGKCAMAQGFINKKLHSAIGTGNIIELDIYAIIRSTRMEITLIRDGPKGGVGGANREPKAKPLRLEKIKVIYDEFIGTIESTYIDQNGIRNTDTILGVYGSKEHTVELGPTEFVKEVSGTIGRYKNHYDVVSSLKIVTNLQTYGPYGKPSGSPFSLPEKKGGSIVGFFGRVGEVIDALGVIVRL